MLIRKLIILFILLPLSALLAQDTALMKIDSSLFYKDYSAAWDSMIQANYPRLPKDSLALSFSTTINGKDLRVQLRELTSDAFEGRETGYPGQKKTEKYLISRLKTFGLKPAGENNTFTQIFKLREDTIKRIVMQFGNKNFTNYSDFYSYINLTSNDSIETGQITFAGFGIAESKYNDYEGLDVKGGIVLVHQGEPEINDSTYLLSGNKSASAWSTRWESKMKAAVDHGVKTLLVVVPSAKADVASTHRIKAKPMKFWSDSISENKYCNVFYISKDMAIEIFKTAGKDYEKYEKKLVKSKTPKSMKLKIKSKIVYNEETVYRESSNVAALIEGSDKKDEVIVYSAHYDHLGKHDGVIYPGADDDGSGTVALLEIAQAFSAAKRSGKGPRRSVLFIFFSGEEKGLLGSEYYSEHPLVPLEKTVVDLNIDMIGRTDSAHEDNPNYVYIIGDDRLSSELRGINEKANNTYHKMELDYKYNNDADPNKYYSRSDHYNFAKNGVPIIFYFNGTHADYHKPSDTLNKINFGKLMFTTKLAFFTGWDIANRAERLKVDKK